MLVAAHQPLFIPWMGYFDKMSKVDLFVIVDNVEFTTDGWIRRNSIRGKSGSILLTVPLENKKSNWDSLINEIKVDPNDLKWRKNHLKTFQMNYSRSKYFKEVFAQLEELYNRNITNLSVFNIELIKMIAKYLEINTPIILSSELNASGKKTDLIIDICKKTNARSFMLGMGGSRDYAKRDLIETNNIKIVEQGFNHPIYFQLHGDFISNLSILDLIFNYGKDSSAFFKVNQLDTQDELTV